MKRRLLVLQDKYRGRAGAVERRGAGSQIRFKKSHWRSLVFLCVKSEERHLVATHRVKWANC